MNTCMECPGVPKGPQKAPVESTGSNSAMQMNHSLFKEEQPETEALETLAARAHYASSRC